MIRTGPTSGLNSDFVTSSMYIGDSLPEGLRLGEYEILSVIGEGGFGIVYLAYDHFLQRQVALKEYMPSSLAGRSRMGLEVTIKSERHRDTFQAGLKSFINEARLLAQFDHRALVKVYRFWEGNGTAYMVMPYVVGPTLKTALAEMPGPPDEAWLRAEVLTPLMEALSLLHKASCLHRDIAPDNILLTETGPMLLDFGAARKVIGDLNQTLTVVLKPGYAPIEQYGEVPGLTQGPWTDVYALGGVVRYAITGKVPVSATTRLVNDTMVPLAQLAAGQYGDAFLQAVDMALAVRPAERPQDMAQLAALFGGEPVPPVASGPAATGPVTAAWPQPRTLAAADPASTLTTAAGIPRTQAPATQAPTTQATTTQVSTTPVPTTQERPAPAHAAPQFSTPPASTQAPTAQAAVTPAGMPRPSPTPPTVAPQPLSQATAPAAVSPQRAAQAPAAAARPARSAAPWWAAGVLALMVAGAVAWWWSRQAPQAEPAASAPTPTPGAASAALPSPTAPAIAEPTPAPVSPTTATTKATTTPTTTATTKATTTPTTTATTTPTTTTPALVTPTTVTPATTRTTAATPPLPTTRPASTVSTAPLLSAVPPPTRAVAPAVALPPPDREPARTTPKPAAARCTDLLQKASLEPLSPSETSFLKTECK